MRKVMNFIIILLVITLLLFTSCTNEYKKSNEDSFVPYFGAIDVYNASRSELIDLDMCDYSKTFGEVKDEQQAVQIAKTVVMDVYGEDESPYVVKLNENANAWIVSGSNRLFQLGGVSTIAIDRETGDILMLIHTK